MRPSTERPTPSPRSPLAWLGRAAAVFGLALAMILGGTTVAQAGDTPLHLWDDGGWMVGKMIHVDDGDTFRVWDERADGYGPTGCLQEMSLQGNWFTVECKHNDTGNGTYESFHHDVKEIGTYRMRLCHALASDCSYRNFSE